MAQDCTIGPGIIIRRLQRFIADDPIGFAAVDINLYAYLSENPVNRVDPSGNVDPWLALRGKLAGGTDMAIIGLFGSDPFAAKCECDGGFSGVMHMIGAGGRLGSAYIISQASGSAVMIYGVVLFSAWYGGVQIGSI